MKKHIKIYTDYFELGIDSIVTCEVCRRQGNINNFYDIHHINGRIGKQPDNIENLILLCRDCHIKAHSSKLKKEELRVFHFITMKSK